ncbi:MAG TPA: hypothetical protein VNF49_11595 [Candidatus Binataceae bacterium]|nr:hypothetical protein [Candidatus Binataceae bacterium]
MYLTILPTINPSPHAEYRRAIIDSGIRIEDVKALGINKLHNSARVGKNSAAYCAADILWQTRRDFRGPCTSGARSKGS